MKLGHTEVNAKYNMFQICLSGFHNGVRNTYSKLNLQSSHFPLYGFKTAVCLYSSVLRTLFHSHTLLRSYFVLRGELRLLVHVTIGTSILSLSNFSFLILSKKICIGWLMCECMASYWLWSSEVTKRETHGHIHNLTVPPPKGYMVLG